MAFTEAQRDQIRSYLGFPRLYISANPFLEQAITTIQPLSEGGSAPDASIENAVIVALGQIAAIDQNLNNIQANITLLAATDVPTTMSSGAILKQDYTRVLRTLRREGTNLIMKVAIRLGVQPLRPYFYSDGLGAGSAFTNDPFGGNPRFYGRE